MSFLYTKLFIFILFALCIATAKTDSKQSFKKASEFDCEVFLKTSLLSFDKNVKKSLTDTFQGCIRIGWLEDMSTYGLKSDLPERCAKNLASRSNCQVIKNLEDENGHYRFKEKYEIKKGSLVEAECKIELRDDLPKHSQIGVWRCNGEFILIANKASTVGISLMLVFLVGLVHLLAKSKPI